MFSILIVPLAYIDLCEAVVAVRGEVVEEKEKVLNEVATREARIYIVKDTRCSSDHRLAHHHVTKVG